MNRDYEHGHDRGSATRSWGAMLAGPLTGLAVSAGILGAGYTWWSSYYHNGSEYKIQMNTGTPKRVTTEGLKFVFGWYDKVLSFPRTRQITTVKDEDVNLRSKDGEEFIGGVRVEYQFDFGQTEADQKRKISKLLANYNITDTAAFWDDKQIDPVEKTINARAKTAAVASFAQIATDEYQGRMEGISIDIRDRLQKIMDAEDLPVKIVIIDTNGVTPSQAVQDRINRIASERRESERADVVVDNSVKVKAATKAEAETVLEFANTLRDKGYSEEAIIAMNCQRLADRADRFGIPFGANCNGAPQGVSVMVDPKTFQATVTRKTAPANLPAAPKAAPQ